ncbi:amidase [Armatimonas rosea]|uniref:Amidase n=1 Tax=Armatimonas rosea TaxID=685828 RepID=A0A7W9SPB3_ARMRO|nr:amidase [Armatimonas rosea]MBB6050362.1 amidase [Armatimonas rosea]
MSSSKIAPFELDEVSLAQLRQALKAGRYTEPQLVQLYQARIAELDPKLKSVIELNPDALKDAERLQAERAAGKPLGPLHGMPILIKDNIATLDKMQTTAGSLALVGTKVKAEAPVATALRKAGAVILGKTNLSEWANFRSTHSSSGWSGRGGQTRNPYALDRSPSGSSSGTGAAIAACLAAAGIGTETDGSILSPSAACGLVGLKPTVGLLSGKGIIPISHTQDTAGPMARTVFDVAILLGALTGKDYSGAMVTSLKGKRIGIARKRFFGYHPATDQLAEDAIKVLKKLGAEVIDHADMATVDTFDADETTVLLYEFKAGLNKYLAELQPGVPFKTLKELIIFNSSVKDKELPYFGQELLEQAQAKGPLSSPEYVKALAKCRKQSREQGIDAILTKHKLDALFAPTQAPSWPIDWVNGDHFLGSSTSPAAVAGYPSITVPAGQVHGLPVGVSFWGRANTEATLLRLAFAFEQATHHRRAPTFAATADFGVS